MTINRPPIGLDFQCVAGLHSDAKDVFAVYYTSHTIANDSYIERTAWQAPLPLAMTPAEPLRILSSHTLILEKSKQHSSRAEHRRPSQVYEQLLLCGNRRNQSATSPNFNFKINHPP
ncbi:uncharacterized protein METZ01_LOCUS474222, partial [marine metagenome]